jgi:hypothetical protein
MPAAIRHYQNLALCQVSSALPSVLSRALGKEDLYRVQNKKTLNKQKHSTKSFFGDCFFDTR